MEQIVNKLKEIAEKRNVSILYACETGSRAWGFPSPDSDYDVRFIYMHERNWYLSLNERKDTIEHMDGDLDITGWDLRKCLVLLHKSNASLIERFQSPIEYYAEGEMKTEFKELIKIYYSPIAVFFHHYSLANKFWEEIKGKDSFKLKSWFYLVRSLLSCNWIVNDNSVLPMHIEGLMKYSPEDVNAELRKLIKLKSSASEKYMHEKDVALNEWIAGLFVMLESKKNNLAVNQTDMSALNDFFLKQMYE
jgi:predicted nucleotidyltransferase